MFAKHFLKRLAVFVFIIILGILSLYLTNRYYTAITNQESNAPSLETFLSIVE